LGISRYLKRERTSLEIKHLYTKMAWLYELDDVITLFTKKLVRRLILDGAQLRNNQKVLELASGTGEMTRLILQALRSGQLTCLDISLGTLSIGRKKMKEAGLDNAVNFVIGDAQHTPFIQKAFDVAICCYALDTVENPEKVIKEIYRVLYPGGRVSVGLKGKAKGITAIFDRLLWEPYLRFIWNCGTVYLTESFKTAGFIDLREEDRIRGYYRLITASKPEEPMENS